MRSFMSAIITVAASALTGAASVARVVIGTAVAYASSAIVTIVGAFKRDEAYLFEGPQTAGGTGQSKRFGIYQLRRDQRQHVHARDTLRMCA